MTNFPMWRVKYRPAGTYTASRYFYGGDAAEDARRRARELVREGVPVRLFERVDGEWVEVDP